jgi:hypothetical protein
MILQYCFFSVNSSLPSRFSVRKSSNFGSLVDPCFSFDGLHGFVFSISFLVFGIREGFSCCMVLPYHAGSLSKYESINDWQGE